MNVEPLLKEMVNPALDSAATFECVIMTNDADWWGERSSCSKWI